MAWTLTVQGMTGTVIDVGISRPQNMKISKLKVLIADKMPNAPHYLQRLIDSSSGTQQELDDDRKLSDYPTIQNGTTIFLLVKPPWNVYVYDMDNKKHEVAVPSSTPERFTLRELREYLANVIIGKSLEGYKLHLEDKELQETSSGRNLTLKDLGIRKESTLFVRKFVPKVVNPKPYSTGGYAPASQGYQSSYQPYSTGGYAPAPQGYQSGYQVAPADFKGYPNTAVPPSYYGHPPPMQQQKTEVIYVQPHADVQTNVLRPASNYLTLSVVLTLLCFICCTWYGLFCTVPAIVFSTMARDAESRGDYASARSNANRALCCNVAGIIWWVLATIIIVVYVSMAVATEGYYDCTYSTYYNYCYK